MLWGRTGILGDPLDSQGETEEQTAAGPAGMKAAHVEEGAELGRGAAGVDGFRQGQ